MRSNLEVPDPETDLEVVVDSFLKMPIQFSQAVKKEESMLGAIRKGIENKMADITMHQ